MDHLIEIGHFGKPHGISGEITAVADVDLSALRCIVVPVEGIDVPFFIEKLRPRHGDAVLVKIDGFDSETAVKLLAHKPIFALDDDPGLPAEYLGEEDADADGFYAEDLVGFKALLDSGSPLGTVVGIDDNTENVLFIIDSPQRKSEVFIPVVDDFIIDIDPDQKELTLSLPDGIIELNS